MSVENDSSPTKQADLTVGLSKEDTPRAPILAVLIMLGFIFGPTLLVFDLLVPKTIKLPLVDTRIFSISIFLLFLLSSIVVTKKQVAV
ncbi:MAG: hypothetical protein ACXAB7_19325 [Candidatus Kariarchaeaceae archaeon]|jgi:hypothetical protein